MKREKTGLKKSQKGNKLLSTQRYLQLTGIHDDTLVLKDGGIRNILEVSSVNFDLKSEDEQTALIGSYQKFLNALNFPVQMTVNSRKLDIDKYLGFLEQKMNSQKNELLKIQAEEHIQYIKKLVEFTDIMEKRFFITIPQNPDRVKKKGVFSNFMKYISLDDTVLDVIKRKQEFEELKANLDSRVNVVVSGLEGCGLKVRKLNTEEIIQVLYHGYNHSSKESKKMDFAKDIVLDETAEDHLVAEDRD